MPGIVAPVADECAVLLGYLAQMRLVARTAAYGLTDDQARAAPSASSLSVGGLIKHLAHVESSWTDMLIGQRRADDAADRYAENFQVGPNETVSEILERYDATAQRTDEVIGGFDDLGASVPVPKGVPWFPDDVEVWSVRWILLHLITETARHAGHADIVRESVDGATAFPLMAAPEGWPASPWMQPWEPTTDARPA